MVEHVVFWILAAGTVLSAIAVISPQLTRTHACALLLRLHSLQAGRRHPRTQSPGAAVPAAC